MVTRKLQWIGFFAHNAHHLGEVCYTLAFKPRLHFEENLSKYFCVVRRSVMMEILKLIVCCYRIKLMILKIGIQVT